MSCQQQCAPSNCNTSLRTMLKLSCAAAFAIAMWAQAQTYTVLHTFTGQGDGSSPVAGLTMDSAGNLYGTTSGFISQGNGTVFKLSRAGSGWILHTLYSFQGGMDGAVPQARVVFGPDGSLYGTTTNGGLGAGTVFNLRPAATACASVQCPWTETVLYRFTGGSDGGYPEYGDLTFDTGGNIYGTTSAGGGGCTAYEGCGTVFELSRSGSGWTESVLYSFSGGTQGFAPYSGVIFDGFGNLIGTTTLNAAIYELTPSSSGWTETTLHTFNMDSGNGLIDRQETLYGTTFNGTVYELEFDGDRWNYELLYDGIEPALYATPAFDAAGNMYGAAGGGINFGVVFELTPGSNGWTYTNLFNFSPEQFSDGFSPIGGVALDASGNLYGTTFEGGDESCGEGCGVVWEITP